MKRDHGGQGAVLSGVAEKQSLPSPERAHVKAIVKSQCKKRSHKARTSKRLPPWGDLLGKPIERWSRRDDAEYGEAAEKDALSEQYQKMCRLKEEHYAIEGAGKRSWYDLAVALARELDDALTIIDSLPSLTHRTAPRWAGVEGQILLMEIETLRGKVGEEVKLEAILAELRQNLPWKYGKDKMSFDVLKANYHTAKRHHEKSKKQTEK